MRCVRTARVVGSTACARARVAAELCLKFGHAIRKDRAVLHRERPKIIGRGIVQLPPTGCEAECPSICKFSATTNPDAGISSVTEHALVRMRRRFDSSCWFQPLKHCRRCSRLVSGRAGLAGAPSRFAALAHSAEHRAGISEVRGSKPRRSTSSTHIFIGRIFCGKPASTFP
jgi:hypothetical protein